MKAILPFTALLAVSACVEPEPITQAPIPFTQTSQITPQGTSSFVVRSAVQVDVKGKLFNEVSGATCEFETSSARSTFTTPAVVLAPDLGAQTPNGELRCTYERKDGYAFLKPFTRTVTRTNENGETTSSEVTGYRHTKLRLR